MTSEPIAERDPSHDVSIINDLRVWRRTDWAARQDKVSLGIEELDALLAAVDERDALKRGNVEAPGEITARRIPAEEIVWHPSDEKPRTVRPCYTCGEPIWRRLDPPLGEPFYEHVDGKPFGYDHMAVRGPDPAVAEPEPERQRYTYPKCYIAEGCEGDEACAALCPVKRS